MVSSRPVISGTAFTVTLITLTALIFLMLLWWWTDLEGKQLVLVDTDCGADDAMALVLLARSPKVRLLAITTAAGNTGVTNVTRNVLALFSLLQIPEVAVFEGRSDTPAKEAGGFYGDDGLGDFLSTSPEQYGRPQLLHPAYAIVNLVTSYPGQVTLVCLGPLTNLALALELYPELLSLLKSLVIIGTAYRGGGNMGPGKEFNVWFDPTAASKVFAAEPPAPATTILPLETILANTSFSKEWREQKLGRIGSKYTDFLNLAERKSLSKEAEWTCYDQAAAALVVRPQFAISSQPGELKVETSGNETGKTQFYPNKMSKLSIVTSYNGNALKELLIHSLSEAYPLHN